MKKIVTVGLLLLASACVHTKVQRIDRMTREILVEPRIGKASEADLVIKVLEKAQQRGCYSVKIVEISENNAIGHCYDIKH